MPTTKGLYTTNRTYVGMLRGTYVSIENTPPLPYVTDSLFRFNSLLLPGETDYLPFNADNSLNNFNVNVLGDAKASNFNPYTPGYYSIYSDNTGVLSGGTTATIAAGVFTFEGWFYLNAVTSTTFLMGLGTNTGGNTPYFNVSLTSSGTVINVEVYSTVTSAFIFNANYTWPLNRWVHLAAVGNGTTVKVYVNGVGLTTTLGSGTFPGSYLNTLSLYPWVGGILFGGGGARSDGVNGYVSNFRFVNGTAVYTADFAPSTTPLTAISGTAMLACQDNRLVDRSINNASLTKAGVINVTAANPFEVPESFASYGSTYLDGTGDYLACGSQPLYAFGTGVFTVETWIYVTSRAAEYNIVATRTSAGSSASWSISVVTSGGITVYTDAHVFNNVGTVPLNAWTHVAFVREGTSTNQTKVYINGINVASATNSQNFTTNTLAVGCASDGSQFPFLGYISDVRITKGTAVYTGNFTPPSAPISISGSPIQYPNTANVNTSFPSANTSLSLLQYSQPHNNSTFLDKSNFRQVITKNGNSRQGTFSPYGANWSAYFDGTGDYLATPTSSNLVFGTGDFCVEMWYYQATNGQAALFSNAVSSGGGDAQFEIQIAASTFYPTVYGWFTAFLTSSVASTGGAWNHLVVCRSGTTASMFLNGTRVATATVNNNFSSTNAFNIGRQAANGAYLTGYISNLRVAKGSSVYDPTASSITMPTQPLTAVSGTQLLTCQSNRFIDNSTNNFTITLNGDTSIQKSSPFGLTANASPTYSGGSGYFDGSGDSLKSAGSTAFTMGTGPFTVEYWVYQTVNTGSFTHHVGASEGSNGFAFGTSTLALYLTTYSVGYVSATSFALNTWNHIAWTRDSSGNVRGYLNGVMVYGPTSITTNITETSFGIAETVGGGYNFTGYLSDIRVIKGMNTYTGNFTPPSAPLSLGGNSTIYSNTANVNTTFAGSNATLMLNFTDAAIKDATTYFNLETVADAKLGFESAYSNVNYSNYFDGAGDYLSIPTNNAFDFGTGDFTLEAWIYRTALPENSFIISASGSGGLFWGFATGGDIGWGRAGVAWDYQFAGNIVANRWYHVALTRSGTNMRMFIDGILLGATQTNSTSYNISTSSLNIGSQGANYYFTGYISNARVIKGTALYTGTFTPPTAPLNAISGTSLLTCQSNRFIDKSTNNFAITVNGDTSIKSFNPFQRNPGSSLYFDGTGDYLRIANNQSLALGTGNFTIEFWANMVSNPSNQVILDQRPDGSHGAYPAILFESKYIRWYVSSATRIESTSALTLNTWYHVAICRVSGTTTMYINGNVSGSTWSDSTNYLTGAAGLVIGASTWSGGSANMNGYIDDLRITRGNARYTANFTPSITMFSVR